MKLIATFNLENIFEVNINMYTRLKDVLGVLQ